MNINDRIKQIADFYNLTSYSAFAKRTGLSQPTVSNYLKGKQKPDAEKLAVIKQSFNDIDAGWLLTGDGNMLKDGSSAHVNNSDIKNSNVNSNGSKVSVTTDGNIDTLQKELTDIVKTTQEQQNKLIDHLSENQRHLAEKDRHISKLIDIISNRLK